MQSHNIMLDLQEYQYSLFSDKHLIKALMNLDHPSSPSQKQPSDGEDLQDWQPKQEGDDNGDHEDEDTRPAKLLPVLDSDNSEEDRDEDYAEQAPSGRSSSISSNPNNGDESNKGKPSGQTSKRKKHIMQQTQRRQKKTLLPTNFTPTPFTVQIGKGSTINSSTGNRRIAVLAENFREQYGTATTKKDKSAIVDKLIAIVRESCSGTAAFVKLEQGRWYLVSDDCARSKVGAVLRNTLHANYKSSSNSRVALRRKMRLEEQNHEQQEQDIDTSSSKAVTPVASQPNAAKQHNSQSHQQSIRKGPAQTNTPKTDVSIDDKPQAKKTTRRNKDNQLAKIRQGARMSATFQPTTLEPLAPIPTKLARLSQNGMSVPHTVQQPSPVHAAMAAAPAPLAIAQQHSEMSLHSSPDTMATIDSAAEDYDLDTDTPILPENLKRVFDY